MAEDENSTRTVVVAVVANAAIAVAKAVAALITGSASMWAEAAHSVADSGNEVLLFIGLRRSRKEPDDRHPFGYGQERYFWTFLAALGIFLIGGALSIAEGVRSLLAPEPLESPWIGAVVLLVAAGLEGYSWHTARKQLQQESRRTNRSITFHLRRASDPSATTVFLEDSAALIGIALAMAALILHVVTGQAVWDAVGSIGIGVLLLVVAALLARRSKALMLDESPPEDVLEPIRRQVSDEDWVAEVRDLRAIFVGPRRLLVNVEVAPTAQYRQGQAEELLRRAGDLRASLLASDVIAQATVTLDGRPGPVGAAAAREAGAGPAGAGE